MFPPKQQSAVYGNVTDACPSKLKDMPNIARLTPHCKEGNAGDGVLLQIVCILFMPSCYKRCNEVRLFVRPILLVRTRAEVFFFWAIY